MPLLGPGSEPITEVYAPDQELNLWHFGQQGDTLTTSQTGKGWAHIFENMNIVYKMMSP